MTTISISLVLAAIIAANETEIDRRVTHVLAAKEPHEKVEAWYRLFKAAEANQPNGLKKLVADKHETIAVQSAWLQIADVSVKQSLDNPTLTKIQKARFIGFLEGRTGISVPRWWEKLVLSHGEGLRFDGSDYTGPKLVESGVDALLVEEDVSVHRVGGQLALKQGQSLTKLPNTVFDRLDGVGWSPRTDRGNLDCRLCCGFTNKYCVVLLSTDLGSSQPLICLERESGKVLWQKPVTGSFLWGGGSGIPVYGTGMKVEDKQVHVFGADSSGYFVHTSDLRTGKTTFEFTTAYTGHYAGWIAEEDDENEKTNP